MAKRRTNGRNVGRHNNEDSLIDIDGAFAPTKGKQSVDYDVDDESIGLTQAFGVITIEDNPEYTWDNNNKWANFDWDASFANEDEGQAGEDAEGAEDGERLSDDETAPDAPAADGEQAPQEDADDASRAAVEATAAGTGAASTAGSSSQAGKTSGRGRHAAPTAEDSPRMRQSKRLRRTLIALIVLAILAIAAVAYFGYRAFTESNEQATQQTQEQTSAKEERGTTVADDTTTTAVKQADVPNLAEVLGMTQDEAIGAIKRGAQVGATQDVAEEGSAIKKNVTVFLTSEPADSRTGGTPTVYLGLNAEGRIIQAGYSASTGALGFGSLSFADAVNNERIIEKTLAKTGVDIPENTVVLPENKDTYSTYGSDGTTVMKERCSFEGPATVKNMQCTWSAVLSYDYTRQVFTGNLSDTVRVIYVYITANS